MNFSSVLLIALGAGILLTVRSYADVKRDLEPKLFRLNFPRLARRFPGLPDLIGRGASKGAIVIGTAFGIATIGMGLAGLW